MYRSARSLPRVVCTTLAILFVLAFTQSFGQGLEWKTSFARSIVPITSVLFGDTISIDTFGVHENATYCIDLALDPDLYESELPPPPIEGDDIRFTSHRAPFDCLGLGLRVHVQEPGKLDTFAIEAAGIGSLWLLQWPSGLASQGWESLVIQDISGGDTFQVDMLTDSFFNVDGLTSKLYIIGLCNPPPPPPGPIVKLVPITITPEFSSPVVDTFGVHESATYCIDGSLGDFLAEVELPPPGFFSFDARFVEHRTGSSCLGQGLRLHLQEPGKIDTFALAIEPGFLPGAVTLSWPAGLADEGWDTLIIQDTAGGSILSVNMLTTNAVWILDVSVVPKYYIIGRAAYTPTIDDTVSITSGWNIVSVPVELEDYRAEVVFPNAVTAAYRFAGGYESKDTLSNGPGYWMKFGAGENAVITGVPIATDTIDVLAGWNMIGSISDPVAVATIISIPGGMVTSPFYGYDSGYSTRSIIEPGKGYWVKVTGAGKLVLSSGAMAPKAGRIQIR